MHSFIIRLFIIFNLLCPCRTSLARRPRGAYTTARRAAHSEALRALPVVLLTVLCPSDLPQQPLFS